MKRNRIRLTESQLHRVIKESVKRVLREWHNESKIVEYPTNECFVDNGSYLCLGNLTEMPDFNFEHFEWENAKSGRYRVDIWTKEQGASDGKQIDTNPIGIFAGFKDGGRTTIIKVTNQVADESPTYNYNYKG